MAVGEDAEVSAPLHRRLQTLQHAALAMRVVGRRALPPPPPPRPGRLWHQSAGERAPRSGALGRGLSSVAKEAILRSVVKATIGRCRVDTNIDICFRAVQRNLSRIFIAASKKSFGGKNSNVKILTEEIIFPTVLTQRIQTHTNVRSYKRAHCGLRAVTFLRSLLARVKKPVAVSFTIEHSPEDPRISRTQEGLSLLRHQFFVRCIARIYTLRQIARGTLACLGSHFRHKCFCRDLRSCVSIGTHQWSCCRYNAILTYWHFGRRS